MSQELSDVSRPSSISRFLNTRRCKAVKRKFNSSRQDNAGDSYEDYDDSAAMYSDDSTAMASSGVYNPRLECQLYSPSVMLRRAPSHQSEQSLVYVYETGSRRRKMALPKGNLGPKGTSGPPPGTLLRRNSTNSHHLTNYRQRRMLQGRLSPEMYPGELTDLPLPLRQLHDVEPPYMMASYDDLHHPYYDVYYSKPFPLAPQHFGLSKYGHLKIDYSFSWNSLDRYIAMD
ncbi:hypothetical protein C0J52_08803 [Blattella germanica]|nr:hypothetical protein C0J52_08803 [Blattella germanica]